MDLQKIGETIRRKRANASLTQQQLATMMNVSAQAVSNWERGENAPDIGLLVSLAALLGCSTDELLGYTYQSIHTYDGVAMYADIRKFVDNRAKITIEESVTLMNSFFYSITELVLRYNGKPIKYIGDAFLCLFLGDNVVDRSLSAAGSAMRILEDRFSIGLAYGPIYIGPVGHPDYAQIDIMGDHVNLAAATSFWAAKNTETHLGIPSDMLEISEKPGITPGKTDTIVAGGKEISVVEIEVAVSEDH